MIMPNCRRCLRRHKSNRVREGKFVQVERTLTSKQDLLGLNVLHNKESGMKLKEKIVISDKSFDRKKKGGQIMYMQ